MPVADSNSPAPLVYSPRSLGEALALFVPNPQAQILAGGTAGQTTDAGRGIRLAPVTISIHLADDLRKVTYGERFLDLGAGLTLNQLLSVGGTWVPPVLKEAAQVIGTSALRNLATVGGNLCQKGTRGDLLPVLYLLGAQFEFRNLRGSRWVSAQSAAEEDKMTFQSGEILTRIRLPQEDWPQSFYAKIGNLRTPWEERLSVVSLARAKNSQLESWKMVFHLPHSGLIRLKELEAELAGQRLPLGVRVRTLALESIGQALDRLPVPPSLFQRDRVIHMTQWILTRFNDD